MARHHLARGVRGQGRRGHLRVPAERGPGRPGRAADRQGRRHHRQDHHQPRQRAAEAGVPAQDPPQRGRVRRGLLRAQRRVRRRLHAVQGHQGGRGVAPQRSEDLDHLGPLRRLVLGGGPHRPRRAQAPRDHPVPGAHGPPQHHGEGDLDHGGRADQRGLPRRRLRARRLRGRGAQQGVPVHLRGPRPRALHPVHLLAHRPAPRPPDRVRAGGDPGRRAAEGRRGDPVADRPAAHPGRGGPDAGPQVRLRLLAGRRPAHLRRPRSTSCSPPSTPAGWPTRPWTSAARAPSSGCGTRTPR